MNTPKTAEISGNSNSEVEAEPLIDPSKGSSPQSETTYLDDDNNIIQVDFVQSTGTQYIDTGIVCDSTALTGTVDFQFLSTANDRWVMGAMLPSVGIECGLYSNQFYTDLGFTYSQTDRLSRTTASFTVSLGQINNKNIYLFSRSWNGSSNNGANCKIYSAEIYDNGQPIRSFVPCYNKNTEEYGLYDTVTEEFYDNAGTGNFLGKSIIEEGEDPKILEYEQYFIDNDITNDILATTITGTGAADDPYVLNSSEDFWWASKYMNYSNKFVELGCDVFLNEEKYDENGNVLAGTSADGRVYKWSKGFGSTTMVFDGKNHTIYGLYSFNNFSSSLIWQADIVQNLTNSKFYYGSMTDGYVYGICYSANKIFNCHINNGHLTTNYAWSGLIAIGSAKLYIGNCSNNSDIITHNYAAVGIGNCDGTIENCVNYGNLLSGGGYSCGIGKAPVIKNCTNYGNVQTGAYSGGITCSQGYTSLNVILDGCKNYGNVTGGYSGALVGSLASNGKITLKNCEVDCQKGSYGMLFGGLGSNNLVIAENCNIKSNDTRILGSSANSQSYLKNCEIEMENYSGNGLYFNHAAYNLKIKVKEKPGWWTKRLFLCQNSNAANLKNIYIETDFDLKNTSLFSTQNGNPQCIDGILVKTPNYKFYYGNDFSAYHIDWKTGALGQSWTASLGFFQSKVDIATLEKMGYERRTA